VWLCETRPPPYCRSSYATNYTDPGTNQGQQNMSILVVGKKVVLPRLPVIRECNE